jgi:hypothetical protein
VQPSVSTLYYRPSRPVVHNRKTKKKTEKPKTKLIF